MWNHVVAWKFWYNPVGSLKFVNNLVVDLKNREIWGQSWCNPLLTGKSPKKFLQPCTWWKWDKNLCTTLYYTGFCIILLFWPICAIFSHLCHLCLASVPSVLSVPICACLCHLGQPRKWHNPTGAVVIWPLQRKCRFSGRRKWKMANFHWRITARGKIRLRNHHVPVPVWNGLQSSKTTSYFEY